MGLFCQSDNLRKHKFRVATLGFGRIARQNIVGKRQPSVLSTSLQSGRGLSSIARPIFQTSGSGATRRALRSASKSVAPVVRPETLTGASARGHAFMAGPPHPAASIRSAPRDHPPLLRAQRLPLLGSISPPSHLSFACLTTGRDRMVSSTCTSSRQLFKILKNNPMQSSGARARRSTCDESFDDAVFFAIALPDVDRFAQNASSAAAVIPKFGG